MLIKQYASPTGKGQQRYSPATIIGAKEYQNAGTSQPGQISTSHIERSNLTIRMQNRRWTRLTNAFSKKWENHELMFALFVAWYNFCRPHMTIRGVERGAVVAAVGSFCARRMIAGRHDTCERGHFSCVPNKMALDCWRWRRLDRMKVAAAAHLRRRPHCSAVGIRAQKSIQPIQRIVGGVKLRPQDRDRVGNHLAIGTRHFYVRHRFTIL
jgi:hypothetical protein